MGMPWGELSLSEMRKGATLRVTSAIRMWCHLLQFIAATPIATPPIVLYPSELCWTGN